MKDGEGDDEVSFMVTGPRLFSMLAVAWSSDIAQLCWVSDCSPAPISTLAADPPDAALAPLNSVETFTGASKLPVATFFGSPVFGSYYVDFAAGESLEHLEDECIDLPSMSVR